MSTPDDNIIDVDPRDAVMKGKTPRRLLWILGGGFILILMAIAVFVVNDSNSHQKLNDSDAKATAAKEGAEPAPKTVDSVEKEQTKKALDEVKGAGAAGQVTSGVQTELQKLKGQGTRSDSAVDRNTGTSSHTQAQADPARDAALRKKEQIATSPIFKGGVRTTAPGQAPNMELELLKRLSSAGENPQAKIDQLNANNPAAMMAALNGQAARAPAAGELEFNAAMEGKKLAAPTGLIPKSANQCLLTPGWLIPVANVEAMNTDLPGEVLAVVREDVYDSLTNTCLAIPKGSKIMATYNPNVKVGQERFNIAASVLQLPNGKRVPMMGTGAYDLQGNAGVEAEVNNHFFKMLGTSFMLGVVGKLSGNDSISTSSANGNTTTNTTLVGKIIGDTASMVLERNKNITPTLTRDQARRFNLKVTREFYMEAYRD